MEKDRLDRIIRLLEITEREYNHDLLLSAKNLQELGSIPFPYIVLVIPCPLPEELVKGEHFILANLLKSIPGNSSQAVSYKEPQVEFAQGVDPTRSTGRRDSLLNGRKMWVDFRILENPSSRRNGFALESPLTFIFIFKWGKPSKNKKPQ